jgi:hypothetical protein
MPLPECLFCPNDAKALPRYWHDASSPMRRYEMCSVFNPARNGPIFRRHGLHPYFVCLTQAGFAVLKDDLSSNGFAMAAMLTPAEFLGLTCGLWLNGKEPDNGSLRKPWQRELSLTFYKIERARRARNTKRETELRKLYGELRARHAPHIEENKALAEKLIATVH